MRGSPRPNRYGSASPPEAMTRSAAQLLRNMLRGDIVHTESWVKAVKPKVLIDRDTTGCVEGIPARRTVFVGSAVSCGVLVWARLSVAARVVKNLIEDGVGVKQETCRIVVRRSQVS